MSSGLGKKGEDVAAKYLSDKGYKIIKRNHRNRVGEIDIIAEKGEVLYLIEVKTRTNLRFGLPEEYITKEKLNRIRNAGLLYCQQRSDHHPELIRILVVSLLVSKQGKYHIKLIEIDR